MSAARSIASHRLFRAGLKVLTVSLLVLGASLSPEAAVAGAQKTASMPPSEPPKGPKTFEDDAMRVVIVRNTQPTCAGDCPEWISAEGSIVPATTLVFEKALQAMGDRKLPVFIASPGGDVDAAVTIGRMLREHHLTVAVAKTTFTGCAPTDKVCGKEHDVAGYRGTAASTAVECASSCVIVLAAGEKRVVASDAKVGVHQVSTVMFENISSYKFSKYDVSDSIIQVERELVAERLIPRARMQVSNSARIYREQLTPFFTEMGVSDKIVALMQKTDPTRVHWMTAKELVETKLATDAGSVDTIFAPPPVPMASLVPALKTAGNDMPATSDIERRRSE
jgi:hypothetical protein